MIIIGSRFPSRVSTNRFAQYHDRRDRGETAGTIPGEAEEFYRALASAKETVRIGMEASGHAPRWFERLVAELQFEVWTGDAAAIRANRERKQKTHRQDAQLILSLLLEDRFRRSGCRAGRNPRSAATVVASASHGASAHASHESTASGGVERRFALQEEVWRERGRQQLESFALAAVGEPAAARSALELLDRFNPAIAELTQAIEREVENCPAAQRLKTHPGVGMLTALAFVLILGDAERFHCGKQVASYLGLVPLEQSSGNRRRLGHITKQGSSILRFLLVEAAQVTVRSLPEWRSKYFHLVLRRGPQERSRKSLAWPADWLCSCFG